MDASALIDMPANEYHARPEINHSKLKYMGTPALFSWRFLQDHPIEQTDAMKLGALVHAIVLEPSIVPAQFVKSQKFDCRYSAQKQAKAEFEAEHAGKLIIDEDVFEKACSMADSVSESKEAMSILSGSVCEKTIFWKDLETGVPLRCRPDILRADIGLKADLKTTRHVPTKDAARKMLLDMHYASQAAFYRDGCALGADIKIENDALIFVCTEPPYLVACYEIEGDAINWGRATYRAWLNKYVECRRDDVWPGFSGIESIGLPAWAK